MTDRLKDKVNYTLDAQLINTGNLHQKFQPPICNRSQENRISPIASGDKVNYRLASLLKRQK